jgi:hypothetical protein
MSDWTDPWYSLDTVSFVGTGSNQAVSGTLLDLEGIKSEHAIQFILASSAGANWSLLLNGSLDNVNWYSIAANPDFGSAVGSGSFAWPLSVVLNMPAHYLQVTGTLNAPAGDSATVTAIIT